MKSPIIKKILIFGITSGAISLVLACLGFGIVEFYKIKNETVTRLRSQMDLLAYNLEPTLLFEDKTAADNILHSLENDTSIIKAIVYRSNGEVFTNFSRREEFGDIRLTRDIIHDESKVGWLEIEAVYYGLKDRYVTYVLLSIIIILISIPATYIFSAPLRRQVSRSVGQLIDTTEALQRSNQDLEQFAYVVSHDLKAPLRGIASLSEWLATDYKDKLGAEGQEQLKLLLKRVRRMHSLIDAILQYSRIGRTKEEKTRIDLNELVKDLIDSLGVAGHIKVEIKNALPTILAQRVHIEQVFQNLLSNAVKFIDKPEGKIIVGCEEDGNYWKFSVSDNGPGIEEKYFEKIFKIFQTLVTHENSESTGVGLAIVKSIVERSGGKVWVTSQVGAGTTFYFTFPKADENH